MIVIGRGCGLNVPLNHEFRRISLVPGKAQRERRLVACGRVGRFRAQAVAVSHFNAHSLASTEAEASVGMRLIHPSRVLPANNPPLHPVRVGRVHT